MEPTNMIEDVQIAESDMKHLAGVIRLLAINFDCLGQSRQMTTLNLIMKLALTRSAKELIIPPLEDLTQENNVPDVKEANPAPAKKAKQRTKK